MTAGALSRDVHGVIISGLCRDLSEHSLLRFPVFSRGHSTLGQSPFTRPLAVQIPLLIKPIPEGCGLPAVEVRPGDWIVADRDGVVVVPREMGERVVQVATVGREVDEMCMRDIRSGVGVKEAFKRHRGK